MTYTPYLIANYNTGLEKRLQPWLIPDDAQEELFDGYVYRGTISKREGYNYFATGERNGQPYTESRIVDRITSEQATTSGSVVVLGNGTPGPYVFRLQHLPVRRGTVTITAGAQSATDDGLGAFTTTPAGGSGTIDYTTGDVSITFNANVAGATAITITYDYFPGYPVLMIATFITATNVKELIVADSRRLNKYNVNNNILEYLGATFTITGITQANPGEVTTSAAHNLTTGDRVFIYGVRGMTEVNNLNDGFYTIIVTSATTFTIGIDTSGFSAYTSGGIVELIYQVSITQPVSNFYSWVNYPDKDSNPRLLFTNNVGQIGYYAPQLTPTVGNYVAYPTIAAPDFQMLTDAGAAVVTLTCLQMFVNKDRLILLRTTENGAIRPQRIRISGTGANCDNFLTSATGAGFIDIPDGTWIQGASFSRDDLLIFTEASTWSLKYTGNDTTPFVLDKIDESRGCDAAFSVFTYLNRTSAASPRGLVISDGYRVERQDLSIPDFSYNSVDGESFNLCFAGAVDADRDHYLIYPPPNQTQSQRVLVTNYDEDNYSIYRLPLSCMGTYITGFDITWADLLPPRFNNWAQFAAAYGNWNSFAFNSGAPFSLGGGHKGEIWRLVVTEEEDNPVRIRNITIVDDSTLEVATDWNNYSDNSNAGEDTKFEYDTLASDTIFFTAVEGMQEVNGQQYPIVPGSVVGHNVFRVTTPPGASSFTAYTGGGTASRVIPFSAVFKKFNPFIDVAKKVRCGWLYMYVDTTGTRLLRKIPISAITNSLPAVVTTSIDHDLQTGDQVSFFGIGGMTQLNDQLAFVTVIDATNFSLDGVDSTGYGVYTSGGYVTTSEPAKMIIDIITDDVGHKTQPQNLSQNPYQGNMTNMIFEDGSKKWYKVFINQTGKFIQFHMRNLQAGAQVNIQATMPGFQPVGRLI